LIDMNGDAVPLRSMMGPGVPDDDKRPNLRPDSGHICKSCIYRDGWCINGVPSIACEDGSQPWHDNDYHGGGRCSNFECPPDGEMGGCLMPFSGACTCENMSESMCGALDPENSWSDTPCSEVPFEDCPNPDDEPCMDTDHVENMCWAQCIAAFAPVIANMRKTCDEMPNQQTDQHIEQCECYHNNDILECTLAMACNVKFDNEYGTNLAEIEFEYCMQRAQEKYDKCIFKRRYDIVPQYTPTGPGTIGDERAMSGTDCMEGVNHCCPCIDCLDDCMRKVECGSSCDNGHCDPPSTGPKVPNQSIPAKKRGKDCGPYQINPDAFEHDICESCGWGHITDPTCCAICNDSTFGDILCSENCKCAVTNEIIPHNFVTGATGATGSHCGFATEAECCAEKERISKLLLRCYRLRWTNHSTTNCQGHGLDGCYTCEDLGRMHQGGWCGHVNPTNWNDTHWGRLKSCMEVKCGYSNPGHLPTHPNESCTPNHDDCDWSPSGACCLGNGNCADLTPLECINSGGTFQGGGVSCSTSLCPDGPIGSCCFQSGRNPTPGNLKTDPHWLCLDATENVCATLYNGTYQEGVDCYPPEIHPYNICSSDVSCGCVDSQGGPITLCEDCINAGCEDNINHHCCCVDGFCAGCINWEKSMDGEIVVERSLRPKSNRPLKKSNIERQKFWEGYSNDT